MNNSDSVLVPVKTLKNALIVLEQRNYCKQQLIIARDSILIMDEIIKTQDSSIFNLNYQIELYKKNVDSYVKIVENKDKEIEIYKSKYNKEKKYKWYGISGGVLVAIISFLI